MHTAFTARNVAKFVAKSLIHSQAAQLTEDAITDHTQFEEDDTIVKISSNVVGWYVSEKLKPLTDKMVDVTADKIVALKEKRQQKKTAEESE